jgi:P4 family phage/plasmid primase-like protien
MPYISDFIKQQNIPYNIIGVFLDDEGNKQQTGEKNDLTIEQIQELKNNCYHITEYGKPIPTKKGEFTYKGKKIKMKHLKDVEKKKSLYLKHVPDLYCLDIDNKEVNNIDIPELETFKNCVWKEGNTKGIHIYAFIKNVPEYSNQQDVWKDRDNKDYILTPPTKKDNIKRLCIDLIKINNMWEDDKKQLYNFDKNNEYPVFEWEEVKHLFDVNAMTTNDKDHKKKKVKKVEVQQVQQVQEVNKTYDLKNYQLAEKALKYINVNRLDSYQSWRNIGCILYYEFKEDGFKLFDEASKRSSNYSNDGVIIEWDIIKKYNYSDIKLATLLYWARQDNPEFCINEEEEYYKPKPKFNYVEGLNNEYYKAIYERDDRHVSILIKYMYPDYFISDSKNLYIYNQYGIYKKDDEGYYFNKIIEGVINHIEVLIFNIGLFKEYEELNKTDDEINEIRKDKKERIQKMKELIKYLGTNKSRKELKALTMQNSVVLKLKEKIDEVSKDTIAFENGVYDLNTKELRKGKPEELISITTGYNYIEPNKDEVNRVYDIIRSMWDTEDKTKYFLHKLAYTLTGNKTRQEVNIHTGLGGNGKSLIFDLLKKTLGDYYAVMSPDYFVNYEKGTDRANSQLVATKGKRIVVVSEPPENSKLQVNKLKMLSGNELIKTRDLNEKAIEFYPQFFIHMLTNDIPKLSSVDGGIERRLKIIEYPFEFKDKDEYDPNNKNHRVKDLNLGKELNNLYMAFFHLLTQYYKIDYEDIEDIKSTTKEYFVENNPVEEWINNNYIITNNKEDRITFTQLKEDFKNDTEQQPPADTTFYNRLLKAGTKKFRTTDKGKTVRGMEGIKRKPLIEVKPQQNDEEEQDFDEVIIEEDDEKTIIQN